MFNLWEKIQIAFVLLVLVVVLVAINSHCNKKMVESCVAGGHSVDYCQFQVMK